MNSENILENKLIEIKKASTILANVSTKIKNSALENIASNINKMRNEIIIENLKDLDLANKNNLSQPLIKRLTFDNDKIDTVVSGIKDLIELEEPTNKILFKTLLDDNLILTKITVPIGVIGVIFESRPDALVQIATLCIKSGNCAVLKGGSEAINTNRILSKIINESILEISNDFKNTIFLIETREEVSNILKFNKYINLIIPRGSNEFVQYIQKNSMIPVLGHADGICHVYLDKDANLEKSLRVTIDSKTQYVSVCNACETLLVHKDISRTILPSVVEKLKEKKVEIRGCEKTLDIIKDIEIATEKDWKTEYLDYIISIKIVDSIDEAIDHINKYGSGHTDCIVTENEDNKKKFKEYVDTANVMINCSTRFADGYRYGFGAEVGISTNKIHARGPVGLEGLIIYKYILEGDSHIVSEYSGENARKYKHKKIL